MIIHLFTTVTSYSTAFLQFMERTSSLNDHWFVFGFGRSGAKNTVSPLVKSRTISLKTLPGIIQFFSLIYKNNHRLFFHYLPYDPTLFFWLFNHKIISKSVWILWGADLYGYQRKNESLRTRMYEFCRKRIIPWFPEIACFVKEDAELAKQIYSSGAKYQQILYPLPVNLDHLRNTKNAEPSEVLHILAGNSADPFNQHLDLLDKLARFADQDILVHCPLSYGGSAGYVSQVIARGNQLFGNKFVPLTTVIQPQEYAGLLNKIHIAVMNHSRQQGLGNILSLLYMRKKIYIRSDITSFSFFKRNNCVVFDVFELESQSFEQFSDVGFISDRNVQFVEEIVSDEFIAGNWKALINKHLK